MCITGSKVTAVAPFLLDPLFASFGLTAFYEGSSFRGSTDTLNIHLEGTMGSLDQGLEVTGKVGSLVESCRFLERIAHSISVSTGRVFSHVLLKREIDFFLDSVRMSGQFIGGHYFRDNDHCHRYLESLWTLPGDVRVLYLHGGESLENPVPETRFLSPGFLRQELLDLSRTLDNRKFRDPVPEWLPPLFLLGDIFFTYMKGN